MSLQELMIAYRADNKLSMREAAEKAGISLQTWMYVERKVQEPTRLTEAKIRRLVEV